MNRLSSVSNKSGALQKLQMSKHTLRFLYALHLAVRGKDRGQVGR